MCPDAPLSTSHYYPTPCASTPHITRRLTVADGVDKLVLAELLLDGRGDVLLLLLRQLLAVALEPAVQCVWKMCARNFGGAEGGRKRVSTKSLSD